MTTPTSILEKTEDFDCLSSISASLTQLSQRGWDLSSGQCGNFYLFDSIEKPNTNSSFTVLWKITPQGNTKTHAFLHAFGEINGELSELLTIQEVEQWLRNVVQSKIDN